MLDKIVRTGSISQDALRLGFQSTCNKGIAKLLKVDDITLEECGKFKEQHATKVDAELKTLENDLYNSLITDFRYDMTNLYYAPDFWLSRIFYARKVQAQKDRKYDVKIVDIESATLNLIEGMWVTSVRLEITEGAWAGTHAGTKVDYTESTRYKTINIETRAMKCVVKYTPYDNYHCRYIPDEAAEAAHEALIIGMKKIMVAFPKVVKSVEPKPDPIIIGHIGEQMFIIAWFGYDKNNHMACNI